MSEESGWRDELRKIVDLMRDVSHQTDPQAAAMMYGRRIRQEGLVTSDGWLSISRRGLAKPWYRITRSTLWKEEVNPWLQKDQLPLHDRGLLSDVVYREEPTIITDLRSRTAADDPCMEYFKDMNLLVSLPQFDDGIALNMNILLYRDSASLPPDKIPGLVWHSNLWGRSVLNLVLRKQLKEAYDALDHELQQVGRIQKSLLPETLPSIPGVELAASYQTSQRAGGDYYDLFDLGGGRWGLLIADVSGHGPPAAVIMAITHAIAHLHPGDGAPGELLNFVNRSLAKRYTNGNGVFVTAFYGVYDSNNRSLTYARAGHNPPRLLRAGVIHELDKVGGLPLGLFGDSAYEEKIEILRPGDALLFYTDGVTEARNPAGEMFGTELLDKALGPAHDSVENLLNHVLAALNTFASGTPPADDQTLLAMAVR
jgi:sigma-B regulation protein RsbU (phosphoserine phosphatase)